MFSKIFPQEHAYAAAALAVRSQGSSREGRFAVRNETYSIYLRRAG